MFGYEPNPMGGETADYKNQLEKIGNDHLAEAVTEAKAIDPSVAVESIVARAAPGRVAPRGVARTRGPGHRGGWDR